MSDAWLEGVRVLDMSRLLPGPFCTLLLAEMGADVIKIEDTKGGDYARYYPPRDASGQSALFASLNRGKRAVSLDLKHPEGAALCRQMAASADVVVESFRPGVLDRLGVGYEALRAEHEDLILCSLSGYGQDGPLRDAAGHDLTYTSLAGLVDQTGADPSAPPVIPGFQVADVGGALYGALGIVSALYARERGRAGGAHIDISLADAALSFHLPLHGAVRATGDQSPARAEHMLTGAHPCYGLYRTRDGQYMAVSPLEPKFWGAFIEAIGLPHLEHDGLSTGEQGERVRDEIAQVIATRTRAEWAEALHGLDTCTEPVLAPHESIQHALFEARRMFLDVQGVTHTRSPLGARPAHRSRAATVAPAHGEHTRAIIEDMVGAERTEGLHRAGVIKCA